MPVSRRGEHAYKYLPHNGLELGTQARRTRGA